MVSKKDKNAQRLKRHARVRAKISGTTERPRLAVYRSNANIYAQIIDDVKGVTLVSASSIEAGFEGIGSNQAAATVSPNFNSSNLSMSGYIYPYNNAGIIEGTSGYY